MVRDTDSTGGPTKRVGLVLAGAVARGAYEAGALSVLLPELEERGERPKVLVGTSSGALNAAFLASRADEPAEHAVKELLDLWLTIKREDVYRLHVSKLSGLFNRLAPGFLDTSPLHETISDRLGDRNRIARNIDDGHLDALAVVATAAATGRATVFIEAAGDLVIPEPDHRKGIDYVVPDGGIRPEHLTASASVPLLFAPVHIDDCDPPWFVDGGMRLNTPIKPALELAADKLVIVATNPACHRPPEEAPGREPPDWDDAFLQFLQAAIADPLIEDMYRLARTNTLVEAADAGSRGEPRGDTAERVGETKSITVDGKKRPVKSIPYLFVAPSERGVFGARAAQLEPCSAPPEMLISKVLGSQGTQQKELLSYVLFDPIFASEAIELGREHAYEELHELAEQNLDWRIGPIDCEKRA